LSETTIDVEALSIQLTASSKANLLAWIDAVSSGRSTDNPAAINIDRQFARLFTKFRRANVLSSTRLQGKSLIGPSTLSESLIRGLSGEASAEDGTTRFSDLAKYVKRRVGYFEPARAVLASYSTTYDPVIARTPEYAEVEVFYTTDRAKSALTRFGQEYGRDRNISERLDFGKCHVSIPLDHRIGKLETASIITFWKRPGTNIELLTTTALESVHFWTDLESSIRRSAGHQVLIFVHGYRTSFNSAVRRTAQLAYDLQFQGPAISYTWPSDDTPILSFARYTVDESNVEWTTQHLQTFLVDVSARFPNATIHLIAHSMGSRALVNAVRAMSSNRNLLKFKQIVLAAPDIDSGVFRQIANAVMPHADRMTMYANSNDEALRASEGIHGYKRAGESGSDLIVINGIDTIDASKIDTGLLGHSYYADSRSVVSDLCNLICLGLEPTRRFGLRAIADTRGQYWFFNP
jgi:esterase/lipase superfamily enzyme